MRHFAPPQDTHSCSDDPSKKNDIIRQIRKLLKQLEHTPCIPRPQYPPNLRFLERKQPRYAEDPDSVPTITHVPLLELRPTSEYKKMMKAKEQLHNVVYVDVPAAESPHASPPWALPKGASPSSQASAQVPQPCPRKDCGPCCPKAMPKLFQGEY